MGVDDFTTGSGTGLFRLKLIAADTGAVTCSDMALRMLSHRLRDPSVDYNIITTTPTPYIHVAEVKLNYLATNEGNTTIYFPVIIYKLVNQAVTSFSLSFAYNNTLFTNVDIVDSAIESRTTTGKIIACPTTTITIQYRVAQGT